VKLFGFSVINGWKNVDDLSKFVLDQITGIVYQKQFIKNGQKVGQIMVAFINNIYDNYKNLDSTMESKSP
jgi:hypothetical protein